MQRHSNRGVCVFGAVESFSGLCDAYVHQTVFGGVSCSVQAFAPNQYAGDCSFEQCLCVRYASLFHDFGQRAQLGNPFVAIICFATVCMSEQLFSQFLLFL